MFFIADLHIHSYLSRATSKKCDLEHLHQWAQLKGITVLGTGDFTHPKWFEELSTKLEPAEEGLYRLRPEIARKMDAEVPASCRSEVRFMLTSEISSIYKKGDQVRKVHSLLLAPDLETAGGIGKALDRIGNVKSDGRPILGLDPRDLLEITLEVSPDAYMVPAHIWTPWFSVLGSKSGFDSLEECFEDLLPHIFAVETGLSSDPAMNWRLSALDGYTLISNSDAHSPEKLGREANMFDADLSFLAVKDAMARRGQGRFLGTLEFYPEEGKYHYDGHRKCGARLTPEETEANGGLCPVCGKKVTVGVMNRVACLADREQGCGRPPDAAPFESLLSLRGVLSEVFGVGETSKKVDAAYRCLLAELGPELRILREAGIEDLDRSGPRLLGEAMRRMRAGELHMAAGYDGEYGRIGIFEKHEREALLEQAALFTDLPQAACVANPEGAGSAGPPGGGDDGDDGDEEEIDRAEGDGEESDQDEPALDDEGILSGLNPEQRRAVEIAQGALLIVAGPGTGKTRTLTHRIAFLVTEKGVEPGSVLAVTFTNKAALEMRQRLEFLLGGEIASRMTVCTFHALGLSILRENHESAGLPADFPIIDHDAGIRMLRSLFPDLTRAGAEKLGSQLSEAKQKDPREPAGADPELAERLARYQKALAEAGCADLDDLVYGAVRLLADRPEALDSLRQRYLQVSVDEYQDINPAQYALLRLLAPAGSNLCAIGDPDQAIYGFRGADSGYFLRFEKDYPGAWVVNLSRNYRSTGPILAASSQMIGKARTGLSSEVWSSGKGPVLVVHPAASEKAEAEFIAHRIETLMGGTSLFSLDSGRVESWVGAGVSGFAEIAVLFRTAAQAAPIQKALYRLGIPHQSAGERPLIEHPAVREVLGLLRAAAHPQMEELLARGAGGKAGKRAGRKRADRAKAVARLRGMLETRALSEIVRAAVEEAGLADQGKGEGKTAPEPDDALERLVALADRHRGGLTDFLDSVALRSAVDDHDPRAQKVSLLTLHAAKGLEFPVVFVAGCEDGLIPYLRKGEADADIDEERRLLYVAMTRAGRLLVFSHARKRFLFGKAMTNPPSRFLADIEAEFKRREKARSFGKSKSKPDRQLDLF